MGKEVVTNLGRIHLAEDVIATMAGVATTECYGIVGMSGSRFKDGISELLGRENLAKGVEVALEDDTVEIGLHIVVGYGTRISEIARNVTGKVRYVVESCTGLKVRGVHIHVEGVKVGHAR
ncbi:MAG TPA: Asp23/Gls24 family envelope stress response protein [Symbiobacteriaceae bacterium]|nr:Asp23/Gls24 family envelope stress response protein [Symbiobacteriaceae bacterium]